MNNKIKKLLKYTITWIGIIICYQANLELTQVQAKPTIYIAGDSISATVEGKYSPRSGWGQELYRQFDSGGSVTITKKIDPKNVYSARYDMINLTIDNHSYSGESLKTFISKGFFDPILNNVKQGDCVIISFGHNDANIGKKATYTKRSRYKKLLIEYASKCKEKGAKCILISTVPNYIYKKGKLSKQYTKYNQAMKSAAQISGVTYMDLGGDIHTYFNTLSKSGVRSMYMMLPANKYANYPSGKKDITHFNKKGARVLSKSVANMIKFNKELKPISKYITVDTKRLSKTLKKAQSYKKSRYTRKSYARLKKVIRSSRKVLYNSKSTQSQINKATARLNTARKRLKKIRKS